MAQHISREEQFDFNKSQFEAIADTAIDAIISIDSNTMVMFWNKAAERLFGYKQDEIMGQGLTKIMPKRYRLAHLQGIKRFIASRKSNYIGKTMELYALRRDGCEFPIELSVSTWRLTGKDFFTAIVRDVSERREKEAETKKALEAEQKIANALQESMLPKNIPDIKGLEVGFFHQSATEKAQVGGDFYDLFQLSENKYGIVMGDVAGKGVEVAVETTTVKSLLREKAYSCNSPSDVLKNLNNSLIKIKTEHFIAITYAIFNTDSSVLRITNAGNPFAYLSKNDRFLKITSVPVSILENEPYPEVEIKMDKGDILVMFTDGLTEPRHDHDFFGEERVRAFIKANKQLSLEQIIQGLIKEARKFSHDNLPDDIVVVGMKKL